VGIIGNIIYSTISTKDKVEKHQKIIRDNEWNEIKGFIPRDSKFLDVGCGAGYAIFKAKKDYNCSVFGIDPEPGDHGVGRFIFNFNKNNININKGVSENIEFNDKEFEVVYSSHVLEHVENEVKSLKEMKRVLKDDGILIIGMPTATMALTNLISQIIFTTHLKVYQFFRFLFSKKILVNFIQIFRITSHSYPRANSIWYDIKNYKVSRWKKLIEEEFKIIETIKPCFYPYPDYPQFFKLHKNYFFSSSVFFICKKRR